MRMKGKPQVNVNGCEMKQKKILKMEIHAGNVPLRS